MVANPSVDLLGCVSADTAGAVVGNIKRSSGDAIRVPMDHALDVLNALLDILRERGVPDIAELRTVLVPSISSEHMSAVIAELPRTMIEGRAPEFDAWSSEFGVSPTSMPIPPVGPLPSAQVNTPSPQPPPPHVPPSGADPALELSTPTRILGGIGLFFLIMTVVYKVSR